MYRGSALAHQIGRWRLSGGYNVVADPNGTPMMAIASTLKIEDYIHANPKRLGGVPVFKGSRVPVKSLFDHLRAGDSIDRFLDDFEGITREQVDGVLQLAAEGLLRGIEPHEDSA